MIKNHLVLRKWFYDLIQGREIVKNFLKGLKEKLSSELF